MAEKKECIGSELQVDGATSLEDCSKRCQTVSTMFAYGTNDFSNDTSKHRCNANGIKGCRCLCETVATDDATCETRDQLGYRLYKYSDTVNGNLKRASTSNQIVNTNKILLIT